jgi:hypothetical protein
MAGRFSITRREGQMAEHNGKRVQCSFNQTSTVFIDSPVEDGFYTLSLRRDLVWVLGLDGEELAEWTPAEFFGIIERAIAEKKAKEGSDES